MLSLVEEMAPVGRKMFRALIRLRECVWHVNVIYQVSLAALHHFATKIWDHVSPFTFASIDNTWILASPLELFLKIELVQFSRSVMSDSLRPHELQHARPPCPSPTPEGHSNSCPLSRWCYPAISSSVVPLASCLQSLPAIRVFSNESVLGIGEQSIGVSAATLVFPMNIQDWFSLGWTGWISLQSKGLSRVFFNTTVQKHQFFGAQLSLRPTLTPIHDY